jgi:hypothetical protein
MGNIMNLNKLIREYPDQDLDKLANMEHFVWHKMHLIIYPKY